MKFNFFLIILAILDFSLFLCTDASPVGHGVNDIMDNAAGSRVGFGQKERRIRRYLRLVNLVNL